MPPTSDELVQLEIRIPSKRLESAAWITSQDPHVVADALALCECSYMGSKRKVTFSFSLPSFLHYSISPTPVRIERTNSGQKIPKWHGEILFPGYATNRNMSYIFPS